MSICNNTRPFIFWNRMQVVEYKTERTIITLSYESGFFLRDSSYLYVSLYSLTHKKKHVSKIDINILNIIDSNWIENYENLILENYFN